MAECYNHENLIEEIVETTVFDGNITDMYPSIKINDIMAIYKNYEMVSID